MTLVAIWWHRMSQRSDGKFSKWANFQKRVASLWKNSIIIGAEFTRDFLCLLIDIKEQNPYGCGSW